MRWKLETAEQVMARRQAFIRALREHSKEVQEELGRLMATADVDDLEWVANRLNEQLESIPVNVQDDRIRQEIMSVTLNQRAWISSVLDNKRTVAAQRARQWQMIGHVVRFGDTISRWWGAGAIAIVGATTVWFRHQIAEWLSVITRLVG